MKKEYSGGLLVYRIQLIHDIPTRLYLLLHYHKGYWDLPKGKLEEGETAQDAAYRELMEETGLTAELHGGFEKDLFYRFKGRSGEIIDKKVTYYIGRTDQEDVILSSEHKGFTWLPVSGALQQLTYLNARNILHEAEQFLDKK